MNAKSARRGRMPATILHRSASFRQGLADALDTSIFKVEEVEDLNAWLGADPPRLVVVGSGDEAGVLTKRRAGTLVVVLMATLDVDEYRHALAAGADGLAHIDSSPSIIADIVRAATIGEVILPAEVARRLAGKPRPGKLELSSEERSLLQRISEGATVVQLADEFFLAERSVRRRLQNVYVRLGVTGRAEAVKLASQLGLVD